MRETQEAETSVASEVASLETRLRYQQGDLAAAEAKAERRQAEVRRRGTRKGAVAVKGGASFCLFLGRRPSRRAGGPQATGQWP